MAKLEGDKIVVKPAPQGNGSFVDLRKAASQQSPVSTIDPKRYAAGK